MVNYHKQLLQAMLLLQLHLCQEGIGLDHLAGGLETYILPYFITAHYVGCSLGLGQILPFYRQIITNSPHFTEKKQEEMLSYATFTSKLNRKYNKYYYYVVCPILYFTWYYTKITNTIAIMIIWFIA